MNIRSFFLFALAAVLLSSCVSNKRYLESVNNYNNAVAENARLTAHVGNLQAQVGTMETQIASLQNQMRAQGEAADDKLTSMRVQSQQELNEQIRRLENLQRIIQNQRNAVEQLRKRIADALVRFQSDELTVNMRDGKVYVSLQEKLLFPSGSAVVNPQGRDALSSVAQVLNANRDIDIVVEGHTDSIPIRGRFEDNWDLSVARATSVVRILTSTYNVDPGRVVASGHSYYDPVGTNATPEGRARNRRTEIILAPRLSDLMQLIDEMPIIDMGSN